jgi:hypothetical protein
MGVLDQSIEALKVLSPILAMVPAVGDNLKGAAELATGICEMIKVRGYRQYVIRCLIISLFRLSERTVKLT